MIGWWRVSRTTLVALVDAIRLSQWTKNLLLFAGLLFASELDDPWRWVDASLAFACYCAVSSAAYLVNDVHDADEDRLHPRKRSRPIASGRLGRRPALLAAGVLDCVALAVAATLGLRTVVLLAAFLLLQTVYTFFVKRIFLADVLTISGLFVIRASAGAAAVRVRISPWLLVCTALLALFLAFAKRRAELVRANTRDVPTRRVSPWYSTSPPRSTPPRHRGIDDRRVQLLCRDRSPHARDGAHDPVRRCRSPALPLSRAGARPGRGARAAVGERSPDPGHRRLLGGQRRRDPQHRVIPDDEARAERAPDSCSCTY